MANDSGVITLSNCVPTGTLTLFRVNPGEIIEREWTFRANGQVQFNNILDNGSLTDPNSNQLDPRNLAHGTDGRLLLVGGNYPGTVAQVQQFQIQFDIRTQDIQPLGLRQIWAIPTGFSVMLTFTEFVINDNVILGQVIQMFNYASHNPDESVGNTFCDANLTFQGRIDIRQCF